MLNTHACVMREIDKANLDVLSLSCGWVDIYVRTVHVYVIWISKFFLYSSVVCSLYQSFNWESTGLGKKHQNFSLLCYTFTLEKHAVVEATERAFCVCYHRYCSLQLLLRWQTQYGEIHKMTFFCSQVIPRDTRAMFFLPFPMSLY